ncbi:hypothetical protein AN958_09784 [Leucoagaricus sp. SymC.cos]|nr:hypothetical protein AN958_09784 [Leucoagaricus sp. SymC.cos]
MAQELGVSTVAPLLGSQTTIGMPAQGPNIEGGEPATPPHLSTTPHDNNEESPLPMPQDGTDPQQPGPHINGAAFNMRNTVCTHIRPLDKMPPHTTTTRPWDVTTHSGRNPEVQIIQPVKCVPRKKMDPATRKHMQAVRKENSEKFQGAVRAAIEVQDELINKIAGDYRKTVQTVHSAVTGESVYKKGRAQTIHNAKTHWMGAELNQDKGPGERAQMDEILNKIKEDPRFQNITPEFRAELMKKLAEH